ncbi:hypothetical protein [Acrocarpospora sp. B8E8]|uniref:hypothetical protein n=1 Tax=Acrocarpospora sp. B8E8 TaxID=3153572 RepID=UPI00325D9585
MIRTLGRRLAAPAVSALLVTMLAPTLAVADDQPTAQVVIEWNHALLSALSVASASASAADAGTKFAYWSANHRAAVTGTYTPPAPGSQFFNLSIELSDRDHRTARQGGKCAYAAIKYYTLASGAEGWHTDTYTRCGTETDKYFSAGILDLKYLKLRVCQVGEKNSHPVNCGRWHRLYSAAKP